MKKICKRVFNLITFRLFSTGSGDVDTSKVVKADENGCISGASGQFEFVVHDYLLMLYTFVSFKFCLC